MCQFTGGLCMMSLPVWLSGHMHLLGGLCLWSHVPFRESLSMGSLSIGSLSMGSLSSWFSVQGGMHPTGMHSLCGNCFVVNCHSDSNASRSWSFSKTGIPYFMYILKDFLFLVFCLDCYKYWSLLCLLYFPILIDLTVSSYFSSSSLKSFLVDPVHLK